MKRNIWLRGKAVGRGRALGLALTLAAASMLAVAVGGLAAASGEILRPEPEFGAGSANLTNPYLPISKFHRCVLTGHDTGQHLRVVRMLRPNVRSITFGKQKVSTAVVKDRVTNLATGELIEQTIDYFAQDRAGNAYYFGEDVNDYKHGKVVGHEGQWRVGRDGAPPGLLMPAHPRIGDTFLAENVPGVAVEKDRVVASGLSKKIDGRTYRHVIRIREHATTPKPAEFELKTYARGTGVITEANGELHLVSCSMSAR